MDETNGKSQSEQLPDGISVVREGELFTATKQKCPVLKFAIVRLPRLFSAHEAYMAQEFLKDVARGKTTGLLLPPGGEFKWSDSLEDFMQGLEGSGLS